MLAAASTASASTDGSEAIITDDELAACIGVLRRLCTAAEGDAAAKPSEAFYTPRLKPLRLALLPLIEDFRSTTGASRIDKIRAGKEKQRERHRREQQQKALDRAATDKTRMRRERLEMLGALELADAPRVPDGAVGMVDGLLLEHRQAGGDSTAPLALPPLGEASGSGEPEARLREAGAEAATEEGASDRGSPEAGLLARGRGEADGEGELLHLRACYICKVRYRRLHHLYGSLCPACAALNEAKRLQTADLRGRVVLLTGARVKIGFQAALKLLRCGARVLATTRFPVDAAARFAALPDFDRWSANLQIFGLDLRDLEALERFCDFLDATEAHLSDIVNNACQTIRRPAQYYRHLIEKELAPHEAPADHRRCLALHEACFGAAAAFAAPASKQLLAPLAAPPQRSQGELSQGVPQGGRLVGAPADGAGSVAPAAAVPSALWSQLPVWGAPADGGEAGEAGEAGGEEATALFPAGAHDVNGQQLDLRTTNSWLLRLGQVRTGEVAEVLAINTLAPFILNSRLRALLQRSPVAARQVVNVSAMEGKFYRYKTANHPHTNMAKAALNMMTRTCAEELAANGVYMNSIDTGWINDENPLQRAARTAEKHHFQTPLDEVDAAARILDPILSAANGEPPVYGRFVKDYQPCEW